MKRSRRLTIPACSGAALVLAVACGSFSSDTTEATDGGAEGASPGTEAGAGDGPTTRDAGGDGAVAPASAEIASGLNDLEGIAATDTTVFVLEHDPGHVRAVSIGGGAVATVDPNAGAPLGIAVANGSVYWGDFGTVRRVTRQPLDGAAPSSTNTSVKAPFAIAGASDRIVVATITGSVGEIAQFKFDLSPGGAVGGLGNVFDVAVSGGDIYWTESGTGRIGHGTTGTGTNETFAMDQGDCQSIAADSSGVYWIKRSDGLIRSKVAGAVGDLASGELSPHSLTSDGTYLYWLTRDGKLRRLDHTPGSKPTTLAEGFATDFDFQPRARALAWTPKYLVWFTTDGHIFRLPR